MPSKKRVKFPDNENNEGHEIYEVPSRDAFTEDDKKNLWFTRSDYHFSRSTAKVISKEAEKFGYSRHLDGVYGGGDNSSSSSSDVQDQLNIWVLHGHSRRGLERWANYSHGQARKDDQYNYIMGVLETQKEIRKLQKERNEEKEFNHERLREVAHLLSRKSRLFAQMLGFADAHAAKSEFGMIDAGRSSPRQQARRNLSLSSKVNNRHHHHHHHRPSAAVATANAAGVVRRMSDTTIQQQQQPPSQTNNTSKGRPGRVPRMA